MTLPESMCESLFVAGERAFITAFEKHRGWTGWEMDCPYPEIEGDDAGAARRHWWTRGFSYAARLIRAIEAEAAVRALESRAPPVAPVVPAVRRAGVLRAVDVSDVGWHSDTHSQYPGTLFFDLVVPPGAPAEKLIIERELSKALIEFVERDELAFDLGDEDH